GSWQWIAPLNLGLVIELGVDLALAPVTRLLEFTLVLALVTLFILVAIAWVLSSILIKPIGALIRGADSVMKGEQPEPINLHTGTELDVLVGLFNRMARAVHFREEELRETASRDSLTGLLNHARIEEHLEREFERKKRDGQSLTFVMLDIDHFKRVNDVHGHQAGDKVLRGISDILKKAVRGGDILGRYGGEEFAIILDASTVEETLVFCERLRRSIEAATFEDEGKELRVTASLGWARVPVANLLPYDLVQQADRALYEAKSAGRNTVRGAESSGA
ncbi:MAG: diguanylate cyclase, partial [Spirochaetota bacterium]